MLSVITPNILALAGLGLQTIAAGWLVILELQKNRVARQRQETIRSLRTAITGRERLIGEVITETKRTNALLAQGAPPGTPDRYSLEEAVAIYVEQIKKLESDKEELKDNAAEEVPELSLVGAILLTIAGALLQIPLILK